MIVDAERRCICVSNGTTAYHNIINSITFQNGYSSVGEKVAGGIFSLSKTLVTNCVVRRCYHETSSGNAYGGGVCMELDVGWCATAGEDPCAWLKRFPRRSPTIHAKEHANSRSGIFGDLPAGKKGLDWDALFAATDANGVEWYVVETESMERKTMVPPKGCIEFLKRKGRA